jgi:hypothetical protein
VRVAARGSAVEDKRYDKALSAMREILDLNPTESACVEARPYLARIKAGIPKSMEHRLLADTARACFSAMPGAMNSVCISVSNDAFSTPRRRNQESCRSQICIFLMFRGRVNRTKGVQPAGKIS